VILDVPREVKDGSWRLV
jgi:hypothetical protein